MTHPEDPRPLDAAPARGFSVDKVTGVQLVVALFFLPMFVQIALFLPNVAAFPHYVSFLDQLGNTAPLAFAAWLAFGLSPRRELGLTLPSPRMLATLTGLAAGNLLVIGVVVTILLALLYPPEVVREQIRSLNQAILVADTSVEKFWMLATIVIGAPIAEELFYRGLIQNLLVRWFRPAVGIVAAAAIFTLAHWQTTRFPAVFAIGLLLGFVYHRTRSLPACMWMHAVNNGLVSSGFLFPELHRMLFSPTGLLLGLPLLFWTAGSLLRATRPDHPADASIAEESAATTVHATPDLDAPIPETTPSGALEPPTRCDPLAGLRFLAVPWALAFGLSFLADPMAGAGARELRDRAERIQELAAAIDERFATDVAWSEMTSIRSAFRGAVKRSELGADAYVGFLEDADEVTQPLAGAEPEYLAQTPTPEEREVLDRLRQDAESRYGLEIPDTPPFY